MNVINNRLTFLDREMLVQTVISFSVRALGAAAAFLLSLVIGRSLGAEEAGLYFLSFSAITILASFSRIGLDNTIVRFVGVASEDKRWGRLRQIVYRSLFMALSMSFFLALCIWVGADFFAQAIFRKPELSNVLKLMSPGLIGLVGLTLFAMGLQGQRRPAASIFTLSVFANFLVGALVLLLYLNSAADVATAYSIASISAFALGAFLFFFRLPKGGGEISWDEVFASCMPLWIVMIMSTLTQWSGQLIAGVYVNSEEVAQLAVAQRTALLTSFILMAVNLVVAPRFAALYSQGKSKELENLALSSVKLMLLFACPIVFVMLVFPEFLMSLFGDGFSDGALLLQILVIGQFINVATGSVGYLLMMSGHERDMRNTVLFSGPMAIGLAFVLAPIYGVVGSAIATAIAIATQNLVAVWMVKKRLGFNTLAVWR